MPQEKRRKVDASGATGTDASAAATPPATGAPWEWESKCADNFLLQVGGGASSDVRTVWELAQAISPDDPCAAFKPIGVTLCGPFSMMAGAMRALVGACTCKRTARNLMPCTAFGSH